MYGGPCVTTGFLNEDTEELGVESIQRKTPTAIARVRMAKAAMSRGMWAPLEARKSQKMDFPLKPP